MRPVHAEREDKKQPQLQPASACLTDGGHPACCALAQRLQCTKFACRRARARARALRCVHVFFRDCVALANDDRDIDLYHWSSTKFSAVWLDTLSVLVARGRAQVGVAAATADWPKRIRDMRYADQEDRGTAD